MIEEKEKIEEFADYVVEKGPETTKAEPVKKEEKEVSKEAPKEVAQKEAPSRWLE